MEVSAAVAKATTNTFTNGSLSETSNKQQQQGCSATAADHQHFGNGSQSTETESTVCYLTNGSGGSGHIDRLNLVLPLTSSTSTSTVPATQPLTFSPTSQLPQLSNSNSTTTTTDYYGGSDVDRTPVNTETKDRLFSFSVASSCRTVDSGTESLCSGDGPFHNDPNCYPRENVSDLAADRILKFFACEDSKSNRFAGQRRPTSGNIRQTSTEDDEVEDEDEVEGDCNGEDDVYSDESTLSESSVSPSAEFAPSPAALITPESVVAAIDAKIKQREAAAAAASQQQQQQNRSTMVTGDKGDKDTHCGGEVVKETVILASPTEGDVHEAQVEVPRGGNNISGKNFLKVPEEEDYAKDGDNEDDEDEDADDDDCPPVRLIRSTSLKTGKTPPGTPRGKKIVRFADALGLDLESVRHIVDDGKPYMPPLAAFKGLALDDEDKRWLFGGAAVGVGVSGGSGGACSATAAEFGVSSPVFSSGGLPTLNCSNGSFLNNSSLATTTPNLRLLFVQPSSDPGPFLERVRSYRVCLENCLVSGPSGPSDMFTLTCIARVLNIGFEKSLLLRYTTNEWLTWTDVPASYVTGSCDGFSDKFSVTFHVAVNSNGHQSMMPGQRLLFALRYLANGTQEFWDNNMGMNYALIYQRS